jgi:hypothetical protein
MSSPTLAGGIGFAGHVFLHGMLITSWRVIAGNKIAQKISGRIAMSSNKQRTSILQKDIVDQEKGKKLLKEFVHSFKACLLFVMH